MRKLVLAAVVTLVLAHGSKPAAAHCRIDCPAWLDVMGYTLAAGLVGGYAYGTGYFIYRDATDARQTLEYGATEAGVNVALGALFAGGTVDAIRHRSAGQAAAFGALALTHGALAGHGLWRVYQQRGEIRLDRKVMERTAALGYATNTLMWGLQAYGDHGRDYGIAEAAVNAPLAAGLGYLAVERARGGETRQAALFGGAAAISGALVLHGVRTAISRKQRGGGEPIDFGLDLGLGAGLGADVAPTVVTDGKAVAPGLGATGTW
jgi:hypothetical protein